MPLRMIHVDRKSLGQGVQVRWSYIFSGAFTTLGFGLLLLLLGNAVGLSIGNTVNPAVGGALRFWSWIYMAATMIFSYYLGSFVATRSNEITSMAAGGFHGVVSWGLASILAAFVAVNVSTTARFILSGIGPNSGNWLAACIVGLGFLASVMGGMSGKETMRYTRMEERMENREAVMKKTA